MLENWHAEARTRVVDGFAGSKFGGLLYIHMYVGYSDKTLLGINASDGSVHEDNAA